ncbi:MAG: hypothetical protein MUF43_14480, partial [Flavobacterium sp.]|nr:hypothetical protein [Flavobacterium sp.]
QFLKFQKYNIMRKLTYIFLALATLISLAVFTACNKEDANSKSESKLSSAKQTYNTETDPEPFKCCFTGTKSGKSKFLERRSIYDPCSSSGLDCFEGEDPDGTKWWALPNIKNTLSPDEITAEFELLNSETLLIKIKEFGSPTLEDLYNKSNVYNITSDVNIVLSDEIRFNVKAGAYPLYYSYSKEYKAIAKIPISLF